MRNFGNSSGRWRMCSKASDVKLWLVIVSPPGTSSCPKSFFKGENEELPEIEQGSIHLTPNEEIFRKCN